MNLGRYPFRAGIPFFIQSRTPYCTPATIREDSRKLQYFARILSGLKAEGRVGTTDPRHIGRSDIEAFIVWMKLRGLSTSTRIKYLQVIDHYLLVFKNTTIQEMKDDRSLNLPRERDPKSPIRALTIEELQAVIDSTYRIEGWKGQAIRGVIALGFGTGCRPKEIFDAEIRDIDLARRQFYVRHPKGEGSWGQSQ